MIKIVCQKHPKYRIKFIYNNKTITISLKKLILKLAKAQPVKTKNIHNLYKNPRKICNHIKPCNP
jgi:hypothetical protein